MKRLLIENQEMLDKVTNETLSNPKLVKQLALHWRHDHLRSDKISRGPDQDLRIAKYLCDAIDQRLRKGYQGNVFIRGTDWKIYKEFLIKLYAVGGAALEDLLSRGIQAIYQWDLLKKNNLLDQKHTNIFNYTGLARLEQSLQQHYENEIKRLSNTDRLLALQSQAQMIKIADTPEYEILIPINKAAATMAAYGNNINTRSPASWCTAMEDSGYFKMYTKSGPLVVIEPKKPASQNERYQLHASTNQFKDFRDQTIPGSFIKKRFPNLGNDIVNGFKKHSAELQSHGINPVTELKKILSKFQGYIIIDEKPTARPRNRNA